MKLEDAPRTQEVCQRRSQEGRVESGHGQEGSEGTDREPGGQMEFSGTDTTDASVTSEHVYLLQSLCLPPRQCALAHVKIDGSPPTPNPILLESDETTEQSSGLRISDALVQMGDDNIAQILIENPSGFTQHMEGGTPLGNAVGVAVETANEFAQYYCKALMVSSSPQDRSPTQNTAAKTET